MDYFNQQTERLILRRLTKLDFDQWLPFFSNNPNIGYLGIDVSKPPETLAKEWIERQFERYDVEGFGHLAAIDKSSGKFVGMGGILPRNLYGKDEFEIGYSILQTEWHKGYATEIACELHAFGKKHKVADRFISMIETNNIGSIKVAENNDMQLWKQDLYSGMNVFIYASKKP